MRWNNSLGGGGAATGTNAWSIPAIPLKPGSNVVTVTAFDTLANSFSTSITIIYTPATQPTFTNVQISGAGLTATLAGLSDGSTVVLQTSADLQNWVPVQTNTVSGTVLSVSLPFSPAPGATFFRGVIQ